MGGEKRNSRYFTDLSPLFQERRLLAVVGPVGAGKVYTMQHKLCACVCACVCVRVSVLIFPRCFL